MYLHSGSGVPLPFNKLLNHYHQKANYNFWENLRHRFQIKPNTTRLLPYTFTLFDFYVCVRIYTHSSDTQNVVHTWNLCFMATKITLFNRKSWQGGKGREAGMNLYSCWTDMSHHCSATQTCSAAGESFLWASHQAHTDFYIQMRVSLTYHINLIKGHFFSWERKFRW